MGSDINSSLLTFEVSAQSMVVINGEATSTAKAS